MSIYTIYKVTNLVNGKIYIGYTETSIQKRWLRHLECSRQYSKTVLYNAIRKHGEKNFKIEEIYQSKDKTHTLKEMEEYFIKEYKSFFKFGRGYNMTYGGIGGDTSTSPNYIKGIKTRDLRGKKNPHYGGLTKPHRENISKAKKGKKPPNYEQWVRSSKGKSYYHNKKTNEEKRFLPLQVPQGWEKGRLKIKCVCGKEVDISNLKKYHSNCK